MKNFLLKISVMLLFNSGIYPVLTYAGQEGAFQQGINFAAVNRDNAATALKEFKPETIVNNYTDHPAESEYVTSPENMASASEKIIREDKNAKKIREGIEIRKQNFNYSTDPDSDAVRNILQKADSIYDVVTGQFGDCTKKTNCTTIWKTETCTESPAQILQYCNQTLHIVMVPKQEIIHYTLVAVLNVSDHNYAGVNVNTITGVTNYIGPGDASFSLRRLPKNVDCKNLTGTIISESGSAKLDYVNFPSCANGMNLDMHISDGHQKVLKIDMVSTRMIPEPKEEWIDECSGLSSNSNCMLQEERCIESNTTHIIDGKPVTRACWQKENTWRCNSDDKIQACMPLRKKGCEQTGSICKNKMNGTCSLYEQSFQCPVKQCNDTGIICNGETYCLDKDCISKQKKPDPDFQRSVSALSAVKEAGKSFAGMNSIFTGQNKSCNKAFLGFIDCCADQGWGKDLHLAQCSSEEKDLAKSRENLQTVYLGEYCSKNEVGVCIEHRKAFCEFPSKLARIIQEQGRHDQLHVDFGDAENADCRGLTIGEFSSLDLGRIDFSDFYADIAQKQRLEDPGNLTQRIDENAHAFVKKGK